MKYLSLLSLMGVAQAHIALWHPSMYGFQIKDPWAYTQAAPLDKMNYKDWWFHGYLDDPPREGHVMELPAGGSFHGEVSCSKALTTMGGNVDFEPRPYLACNKPGDNGNMGAIHTNDKWGSTNSSKFVKGCGLSIAYKANVHDLKPEDFVVISVNHTCPWTREVEFKIPEGLPPCPEGGCHCMWGWIPDPSNVQQMYTIGYRCTVTGAVGNKQLAAPQVARKCPYEKNNCTVGAKQMHFWAQNEGNNNNQGRNDPPFYNSEYGYQDGAQLDIWQVDDGANWIKNETDWAPRPYDTMTKEYSATGTVTTYPEVTAPGVVVSTIPVGASCGPPANSPIVNHLLADNKPPPAPTPEPAEPSASLPGAILAASVTTATPTKTGANVTGASQVSESAPAPSKSCGKKHYKRRL